MTIIVIEQEKEKSTLSRVGEDGKEAFSKRKHLSLKELIGVFQVDEGLVGHVRQREHNVQRQGDRNKHVFHVVPSKSVRYIEGSAAHISWNQILKGFGC